MNRHAIAIIELIWVWFLMGFQIGCFAAGKSSSCILILELRKCQYGMMFLPATNLWKRDTVWKADTLWSWLKCIIRQQLSIRCAHSNSKIPVMANFMWHDFKNTIGGGGGNAICRKAHVTLWLLIVAERQGGRKPDHNSARKECRSVGIYHTHRTRQSVHLFTVRA